MPDYVSYFIEKSKEPGFDFSSMRKEMESQGVPEHEIKSVIWQVDDAIIERDLKNNKSIFAGRAFGFPTGVGWIIFGTAAMAVGVYFTIASFFRAQEGRIFVIAWGPMLVGISSLLYGINRRKHERTKTRFRKRWTKE